MQLALPRKLSAASGTSAVRWPTLPGLLHGMLRLECTSSSWGMLMLYVFSCVEIRALLEQYTYGYPLYRVLFSAAHLPLFYLCVALSLAIAMSLLLSRPIQAVARVTFLLMPTIILIPLVDILFYGPGARGISYVPHGSINSVGRFVQIVFLRGNPETVSMGQWLFVHATAVFLALYAGVVSGSRRTVKAVLAWATTLVVLFFYLNLRTACFETAMTCTGFLRQCLGLSSLASANYQSGIFHESDSAETAMYMLVLPLLLCIPACISKPGLFRTAVGNLRATRLMHYCAMVLLGVLMGCKSLTRAEVLLDAPLNLLAVVTLVEMIGFAFISAVWLNDYYDQSIDALSNRHRPLASGALSPHCAKHIALFTGIYALALGALLGSHIFLYLVLILCCSFLYSSPPLRLRRCFPFSSLTIGFINFLVVQTGFALVCGNTLHFMQFKYALALIAGFSLLSTFKDVKDRYGDSKNAVCTLMTLLPSKTGLVATGICIVLGTCILSCTFVPGLLGALIGAGTGLVGSVVVIRYAVRTEGVVFALYFAGMTILGGLYVLL